MLTRDIRCGFANLRVVLDLIDNEDVAMLIRMVMVEPAMTQIHDAIRGYMLGLDMSIHTWKVTPGGNRTSKFAHGFRADYTYFGASGVMRVDIHWSNSRNAYPEITSEITGRPFGAITLKYYVPARNKYDFARITRPTITWK